MTVCIAAICVDDDGDHKIVVCADRKSSSILGSAETALKVRTMSNNWFCLTAGTESDILALLRLYRTRFRDSQNLRPHTIDSSMKEPLYERKRELAEDHVRRQFAMSYEEFLKDGKQRLPPEQFYGAVKSIADLNLNAEFIVVGFIDGFPEIYVTDNDGRARALSNFAVVGEGGYIAQSALLRRKQEDVTALHATLYNVYEAKKFAESIGSVGPSTLMAIASAREPHISLVSSKTKEQLDALFAKYGPQGVPHDLKLEGEISKPITPMQEASPDKS